MLFSSITFLYYFLPCILILYFVSPGRIKNMVLLIASLVFYAWGGPVYVILMLFSVTAGFIFGLLIEKYRGKKLSKIYLCISVSVSIALLCFFKYADFFIENFNAATGFSVEFLNIALPIGISFYSFQLISYSADVYRGADAQKNYINLALYISMFPQLIAGPIVRYSEIAKSLVTRKHSISDISDGISRFVIGLSKKVLLANALGELCSTFLSSGDKSVLFYWLYAVSFSLQIYFDFSGYSDMAIGLGRIFGFNFSENFNYPYISGSITEFWRRWHISLGSWFRDYVYIPMGGNRVSKPRWFFNIFIVWMLTGFWHGASWSFIVWGLYFAVLLIAEKMFLMKVLNKTKVISHLYVIFTVIISFVIFNATDMKDAVNSILSMFGARDIPFVSKEFFYYIKSYAVTIITSLICATPIVKSLCVKILNNKTAEKMSVIVKPALIVTALIASTALLVDGSFNPFLYFRF